MVMDYNSMVSEGDRMDCSNERQFYPTCEIRMWWWKLVNQFHQFHNNKQIYDKLFATNRNEWRINLSQTHHSPSSFGKKVWSGSTPSSARKSGVIYGTSVLAHRPSNILPLYGSDNPKYLAVRSSVHDPPSNWLLRSECVREEEGCKLMSRRMIF